MIEMKDLGVIGFLIFLEGILSIDNAIALALLAKDLPPKLQKRALTYGLVGAVGFRFISLFFITRLMQFAWVKILGGAYLLFIALKFFYEKLKHISKGTEAHEKKVNHSFWKTVILIELTDIAFAVDSILAAVAVTQKLAVVFIGGILGIIMMRVAAAAFIKLLERFPNLEMTAYLLITTIGSKLFIQGLDIPGIDFHTISNPAFWIFWLSSIASIGYGLANKRPSKT